VVDHQVVDAQDIVEVVAHPLGQDLGDVGQGRYEEIDRAAAPAAGRGLKVLIAGAGGAAHLPGVLAAVTELPVIGVPIGLPKLDGLDSLLSIVQMPSGIPVATVGIDAATNAGILAARILALADTELAGRLAEHRKGLLAKSRDQDDEVAAAFS